jgi:hypothetical protein
MWGACVREAMACGLFNALAATCGMRRSAGSCWGLFYSTKLLLHAGSLAGRQALGEIGRWIVSSSSLLRRLTVRKNIMVTPQRAMLS